MTAVIDYPPAGQSEMLVAANFEPLAASEGGRQTAHSDLALQIVPPGSPLPTFFLLVLDGERKALTDRSRDIPLFRYEAVVLPATAGQREFDPQIDPRGFMRSLERSFIANLRQGEHTLARVAEAHTASNCHGWIFTGGEFGIQDPHVPCILKENGYTAVADAEEGDLAIYRADGAIRHSGVVRRAARRGPILVESKWGPFGVFLHAAEAHPGILTYYRAPRWGHALRVAAMGD